jgi:hypothetical protein
MATRSSFHILCLSLIYLGVVMLNPATVVAFARPTGHSSSKNPSGMPLLSQRQSPFSLGMGSKRTLLEPALIVSPDIDSADKNDHVQQHGMIPINDNNNDDDDVEKNAWSVLAMATASTAVGLVLLSETASAAITMPKQLASSFDPSTFVPVCAASDSFYRLLQSTTQAVVGKENFVEYGPLIASGLLRVRLELCVVESFFNEAVGPFIQQNGLTWVLPLHETVETFLAGTVFALATTFILVGSTKLLTVIFTYADFFVGGPLRLVGGFFFDRARGRPVTLDVGIGPFKTRVIGPKDLEYDNNSNSKYDFSVDMSKTEMGELPTIILSGGIKALGQAVGLLRELLDAIDLFVGKSLILWVTAYVIIKFVHFKVFPDFPF